MGEVEVIEVGALVAILYSLPKHHIGESEAVSTDGSGSQKYWTIRLYLSTVVIVAPYATRGLWFRSIDVAALDGGECGARSNAKEGPALEGKIFRRRCWRVDYRVEGAFKGSLWQPNIHA